MNLKQKSPFRAPVDQIESVRDSPHLEEDELIRAKVSTKRKSTRLNNGYNPGKEHANCVGSLEYNECTIVLLRFVMQNQN